MTRLSKDSQFTFRTNKELLVQAKKVVGDEQMDMSTLFNRLLEYLALEGEVPTVLLEEGKSRHERLVDDLYEEILSAYTSYETGQVVELDEAFEKYGL
ncbi:type II toxin-antitoxin system RelB/ParD family antitoxin [Streptococcus oricebi]|uniref:Addiction module antitoxin RelB n=1 Tax=Streptococcus oricebi TaxID=1547447 RepID=A0ABS5B5R1_9STRE|nr:addiction module antitoxin RelB [Streptococcus oricebi]MBP2624174.1 addiction module antitoxin RelB [Streptococcus oricebi]